MNSERTWNSVDLFFEVCLLGLLTSGYLAVAGSGYLDTPTALLTALGLILRACLVFTGAQLPLSPGVVNGLTIAYIGFYPIDYAYVSRDFLTSTVHLVFFLAIVKILTAQTERDYFYVKVIAFLELLAASILSSSANYFLFLALFLLFGVGTFATSEIRHSASKAETIVRTGRFFNLRLMGLTIFTVGSILVLSGSLFFLLPRTARAAFQHFIPDRYHLPGFSNEVTLGQIGELKSRSTAVMHVRMLTSLPNMPPLKWRGIALSQFDGKRWYNENNTGEVLRSEGGVVRVVPIEETLRGGRRIAYEVVMQETISDAIFIAGNLESLQIFQPIIIRTPTNSFRLSFGPSDRLRYIAYSLLEADGDPRYHGEPMRPWERSANLKLPGLDPRIGQLAFSLAARGVTEAQRARLIENHLRTSYPYTTELPKTESPDPVADFLFQRKKGHCEYFASAMAVMLRSIGIPARVATGFQSGVFNPLSGWYLIRANDAHSWVEAWVEGKGWTTYDPTPPDPNPNPYNLSTRLQLYADAMQVFWQDWVLSYDLDRQLNLAMRMEESGRSVQFRGIERLFNNIFHSMQGTAESAKLHAWKAVFFVLIAVTMFLFGPAIWKSWRAMMHFRRVREGVASASDATILYQRMLDILERKGIQKPRWQTPREFVNTVRDPDTLQLVERFTNAYNDLRFGNRLDAAPQMVMLLEELGRPPAVRKSP